VLGDDQRWRKKNLCPWHQRWGYIDGAGGNDPPPLRLGTGDVIPGRCACRQNSATPRWEYLDLIKLRVLDLAVMECSLFTFRKRALHVANFGRAPRPFSSSLLRVAIAAAKTRKYKERRIQRMGRVSLQYRLIAVRQKAQNSDRPPARKARATF
jgi:hypothetical protein